MTLLDRYILKQFLVNFIILFSILFLFSCIIDLFVNINDFLESVDKTIESSGTSVGPLGHFVRLAGLIGSFYFPRLFQFYAFLVGLVTIGATGFTLVQLHRHRELTAVLAAGVSLHRVAMPIIAAAIGLNILQFVNREVVLPHYAAPLIRSQGEFAEESIRGFRVPLLQDSSGKLIYARRYRPAEEVLENVVILTLDDQLRWTSRIQADQATWRPFSKDEPGGGADGEAKSALSKESGAAVGEWILENGEESMITKTGAARETQPTKVDAVATDIDPTRLLLFRHQEFRQMLNLRQIGELEASYRLDPNQLAELARVRYGRFAQILINITTLLLTLPFFLLRSPANLLIQSVKCASFGIVAQIGGAVGSAVGLPGIPPAASVFLFPLLILLPLAVATMSRVET